MKIEGSPKDIEELTGIKDYMTAVPFEIEKLMGDVKTCTSIYDILNSFNYKFNDDDDFDKKWRLIGSPQETMKKIITSQT